MRFTSAGSLSFFRLGRTFLRRLENEDDRSRKTFTHGGEYGGDSQNGSDVNIVTTGVSDPDILSIAGGAHCGLKREGILFGHWQRIEF